MRKPSQRWPVSERRDFLTTTNPERPVRWLVSITAPPIFFRALPISFMLFRFFSCSSDFSWALLIFFILPTTIKKYFRSVIWPYYMVSSWCSCQIYIIFLMTSPFLILNYCQFFIVNSFETTAIEIFKAKCFFKMLIVSVAKQVNIR